MNEHLEIPPPRAGKRLNWLQITLIVMLAALLTSLLTIFLARLYLFPGPFKPVKLSPREQKTLDAKIEALTRAPGGHPANQGTAERNTGLAPERYSEKDSHREIQLTERELNALLSRNTGLAKKLAFDLSDDLVSAILLVPLDPELPIFGGKTLRVAAGVEVRYAYQKPVVALRGVSVWGIPIPNAWLGGMKNIDLVREFGMQPGFWHTFSAGVEDIRITDGRLTIKLKE